MIIWDYSELLGRMTTVLGTQRNFAKAMGLSERSMSSKLNNNVNFTQEEIARACKILDIDSKDISKYFFQEKVQ